MQAIVTKYLGPTETKGARVKATAVGGDSVTVSRNFRLDVLEDHRSAAIALLEKLAWKGEWIEGDLQGGKVYVPLDGAVGIVWKRHPAPQGGAA